MNLTQIIKTRLLGYSGVDADGYYKLDWEERRQQYAYADMMYDNTIYSCDTGKRKEIFKEIIGRTMLDNQELIVHFNPYSSIIDAYQHCMRGTLGNEIGIERDGNPLENPLDNAIKTIWKDSRFDERKETFQHFAASHGGVGLRVNAIRNEEGQARISITPVPLSEVVDIQESPSGAITEVLFEYTTLTGPLGEDRQSITYRERWTKDEFQRWRVGDERRSKETQPNELGVCPFVICRHRNKGRKNGQTGEYGLTATHGSEDIIHLVNIRCSQVGLAIDKALWAKWFIAAGSKAPEEVPIDGTKLIYSRVVQGDPTPMIQAIVEKIDADSALKQIDLLMASLIQRQPELVLDNIEAISGQSGETIAKLLTPVQSRIFAARQPYEHSIIDALRIALSWGVLMGEWDLGTGSGSKEAADRAYRSGLEDFKFNQRPALPQTAYDIKTQAEAKFAEKKSGFGAAQAGTGIVPLVERIKVAGYGEAEAQKLAGEVKQEEKDNESRKQSRPEN